MKETEEDIAARLAGSLSVNSDGEALILAGVRAAAHAIAGGNLIVSSSYDMGRELGFVLGMDSLIGAIRARAGAAFADGRDDEAKLLRNLAIEYERKANEARRAFQEKHQGAG